MEPLISVIVPVYNTRPYLKRCVESLLAQTWPRLEIILVDDGSPDGAGAVCDAYGARFPQVRVIHQENGGLARARNTGLRAARGDYIGWVDSDDWAAPDLFAYLAGGLRRTGCDLALCGWWLVRGEEAAAAPLREAVLPSREAQGLLYRGRIQNWVWNKLAPRELYRGISFPEGRDFEDIHVMYRLFRRARRILVLPEPKYYYRQREDSISRRPDIGKKLELCQAMEERYRRVVREDPGFGPDLMGGYLVACSALGQAVAAASPGERRKWEGQVGAALGFLARRRHEALEGYPGRAGRLKLALLLLRRPWSFRLGAAAAARYEKRRGRGYRPFRWEDRDSLAGGEGEGPG